MSWFEVAQIPNCKTGSFTTEFFFNDSIKRKDVLFSEEPCKHGKTFAKFRIVHICISDFKEKKTLHDCEVLIGKSYFVLTVNKVDILICGCEHILSGQIPAFQIDPYKWFSPIEKDENIYLKYADIVEIEFNVAEKLDNIYNVIFRLEVET